MSIINEEKIPVSFTLYWLGQVFSLIGSEITQFAIIWWIVITYQTPFILGVALFAGQISRILVLPLVGIISDSKNRKNILIFADFFQALLTLFLIFSFMFSFFTLELLLILLAVRGFFQSIHANTSQSIIPQLVPKQMYNRLNAMNLLSNGISSFGGPLVGAVLIESFGKDNIETILWIDVITFLVALIAIGGLKIPLIKEQNKKQPFLANLTSGIKYIKQRKILQQLLLISLMLNLTLSFTHVLIPLLVLNPFYFNGGTSDLALSLGIQSFGLILASIIISFRSFKDKYILRYIISNVGDTFGVLIVGVSFYLRSLPVLLLGQFITGLALSYYNVNVQTIWQQIVPNELLGRIIAVRRMIAQISYPLALFIAGILGEIMDPVVLVISGVVINLGFLFTLWTFSQIKNYDVSRTNLDVKSIN